MILMLYCPGRTWYNAAGAHIGTSGSSPMSVSSSGIVIDSLDANHGLMNQESQDVDSQGQIHIIISYVPGALVAHPVPT